MAGPNYTLKDLFDKTQQAPKQKAKNSRLIQIRTRKNLARFSYVVKSFESYSSDDGHIVSFMYKNLPPFDKLKQNPQLTPLNRPVRVHCTCPAWQYYGSAFNAGSNVYHLTKPKELRPPDIRDPDRRNLVCKHVIRVIQTLRGKSFVNLLKEFKVPVGMEKKSFLYDLSNTLPILKTSLKENLSLTSIDEEEVLASLSVSSFEDTLERFKVIVGEEEDDL